MHLILPLWQWANTSYSYELGFNFYLYTFKSTTCAHI
nr:MAG TPA: hypothetical protein [Caudoviricetes sp.]